MPDGCDTATVYRIVHKMLSAGLLPDEQMNHATVTLYLSLILIACHAQLAVV